MNFAELTKIALEANEMEAEIKILEMQFLAKRNQFSEACTQLDVDKFRELPDGALVEVLHKMDEKTFLSLGAARVGKAFFRTCPDGVQIAYNLYRDDGKGGKSIFRHQVKTAGLATYLPYPYFIEKRD